MNRDGCALSTNFFIGTSSSSAYTGGVISGNDIAAAAVDRRN
jgi:hypothetical protein